MSINLQVTTIEMILPFRDFDNSNREVCMNDERRTIVGGRSRSNRLVGDFPRGIEILLKKASVDPVFRQFLLQDPLTAAQSIELDLKPVEISILNNTPISILQRMIASIRVPKQHVNTFRTGKTAAI